MEKKDKRREKSRGSERERIGNRIVGRDGSGRR